MQSYRRLKFSMDLISSILCLAAPVSAALPPNDIVAPGDVQRVALIENVAKSVVRIRSARTIPAGNSIWGMSAKELERMKRRDPMMAKELEAQSKDKEIFEEGTGFAYDSVKGLFVTAAHIVDKDSKITVFLSDGTEKSAELVGLDHDIGIAVIRVKDTNLPSVVLAQRKPKIGETLIIVGRLLPFDSIGASQGMMIGEAKGNLNESSEYDRQIGGPVLVDYIMLDNLLPMGGMGGGPVVNMRGEAVGIVSAIWGKNGYGQSTATMAVPIADLRPQIEEIILKGRIFRSKIGIDIFCKDSSCRVSDVKPNGSAEKAGMRESDKLISLNGTAITGFNSLRRQIAALPIGSEASIVLKRNEDQLTLKVQTEGVSSDINVKDNFAPPVNGYTPL
jgi:serine protease Do